MKLLYLKGMNTTKEELGKINSLFIKNDLDFKNLYDDYSPLVCLKKAKLQKGLSQKIEEVSAEEEVILVSHVMGCNLGVLAAEGTPQVKGLVLLSPELEDASKDERENIEHLTNLRSFYHDPQEPAPSTIGLKNISNLILFKRTQILAGETIRTLETPTKIIYSLGDQFVSRKYFYELQKKENISVHSLESCNHNPLLSPRKKEALAYIKHLI